MTSFNNPTVDGVLTRIALLEQLIIEPSSGSTVFAYDTVPYSINAGDMPLFINIPGRLTDSAMMDSDDQGREYRESREFFLNLFYAPYSAGQEGEMIGLLRQYFDLVHEGMDAYPHLQLLPGVVDAVISGDSGISNALQFGGQRYFGIQFTMRVITRVRRPFANGE